jgi:hypothetical protein
MDRLWELEPAALQHPIESARCVSHRTLWIVELIDPTAITPEVAEGEALIRFQSQLLGLVVDDEKRREHKSARTEDSFELGEEMHNVFLEHVGEHWLEDNPVHLVVPHRNSSFHCRQCSGRVVERTVDVQVSESDKRKPFGDMLLAPLNTRAVNVKPKVGTVGSEHLREWYRISTDATPYFQDVLSRADRAIAFVSCNMGMRDPIPSIGATASQYRELDWDVETLKLESFAYQIFFPSHKSLPPWTLSTTLEILKFSYSWNNIYGV